MTWRSKRLLSWACLTLQLVGAGLAFGRMLCIASDGHIALEVAHAGSCATEDRRHHGDAEDGVGCADHPCTDIALSNAALAGLLRTSDDGTPPPATVTLLVPLAASRSSEPIGRPTASTAPPPGSVDQRRTVVLRV